MKVTRMPCSRNHWPGVPGRGGSHSLMLGAGVDADNVDLTDESVQVDDSRAREADDVGIRLGDPHLRGLRSERLAHLAGLVLAPVLSVQENRRLVRRCRRYIWAPFVTPHSEFG